LHHKEAVAMYRLKKRLLAIMYINGLADAWLDCHYNPFSQTLLVNIYGFSKTSGSVTALRVIDTLYPFIIDIHDLKQTYGTSVLLDVSKQCESVSMRYKKEGVLCI